MTTAAQVKKLVEPLLEKQQDLALVGRWIFVKPIRHFARGIFIGHMLDAAKFRPQWAVVHLFQRQRFFPLDWGEWLYNDASPRPGSWRISDPDISSALIEQIEQRALPALRAMTTLDDYLSFVSGHYFRHQLFDWPDSRLIVDAALGNLDAARMIYKENVALWSEEVPTYDDEDREHLSDLLKLGSLVIADDRAGVARTLHEWEAVTVKNFKIEHLWEPSPFPIERE